MGEVSARGSEDYPGRTSRVASEREVGDKGPVVGDGTGGGHSFRLFVSEEVWESVFVIHGTYTVSKIGRSRTCGAG